MSSLDIKSVQDGVEHAIESGAETGLQVVAYHHGENVIDLCAGVADPETGHPVTAERVASFSNVRDNGDEPVSVMFGIPIPNSVGGYWLGGHRISSDRAIWHPGAGDSIGWADPENKLAVAICHNRMFNTRTVEDDPILPITRALAASLGIAQ